MLPAEFCRRILADADIPNPQGLLEALSSGNPCVAIRHNRLKGCRPSAQARLVPWCSQGEYLAERPQFTLDPALHQGLYYVQDPSSMAIASIIESLQLQAPVAYLDACAAPGGKTTAAIDMLPEGSLVVANEADPSRAGALDENLTRWGAANVAITVGPAQKLARLPHHCFDIIAADVPCSGEGMMRKDPHAREQWTPALVAQCARLQADILDALWPLLRPGGVMIYSTCTFAREEDEAQVQRMVDEFGAEQLPLPSWPGVVNGHFYPHLVEGEGLYMALLRKPPAAEATEAKAPLLTEPLLRKATRVLRFGPEPPEQKGRDMIPSHGQVMLANSPAALPRWEIDRTTALQYLRREAITLDPEAPRGLLIFTHQGYPLGRVNNLGNRANNLLPKSLRILKQL